MSIDKAPNLIVSPKERGGGINDESNHAHTHSHTHRYTHIHTLMLANTHNTHTQHTPRTHTHARAQKTSSTHAGTKSTKHPSGREGYWRRKRYVKDAGIHLSVHVGGCIVGEWVDV